MAEARSHIELRFGGAQGYFFRHYSVVGPLTVDAENEPFRRIAVQREKPGFHANFRNGTRLLVSRPIGAFRLARNLPHVLLVAGGIGITPILPMMRAFQPPGTVAPAPPGRRHARHRRRRRRRRAP